MTTETPVKASKFFDEIFQNLRKAAETSLKMQQEILGQWTTLFPTAGSQAPWVERIQDFRKQWNETVSDLARRHRQTIDKQYQAAVDSLDAALRMGEATSVEEYRRRFEQLCRKTIDCLREVSETQVTEFQEAVSKWTDLTTKAGK